MTKGTTKPCSNYGKIKKGDKTLVMGPGVGSDALVVSALTQNKVYAAGINPFEVANTRQTARLCGFRRRCRCRG